MEKTFITLKDRNGAPITNTAAARKIIREFVADNIPRKNPDDVHVKRLDNKGNYTATI